MNLSSMYKNIAQEIKQELQVSSIMAVPRIQKVVLNMGLGAAAQDKKVLEHAVSELALITGQKPVITYAKKSIAAFKIRDGFPIGCSVTLRNNSMWNFLDKLLHVAIPRIRDFRGLNSKSFDGFGNFSFGLKEQIIFPEIDYDKIYKISGLDISIVSTAKNNREGLLLLKALGFPFV